MRTIWSAASLLKIPDRDRLMVLFVYPLAYGVTALSYLPFSVGGGSKVMRAYLTPWGSTALTLVIGLSALGGLVGLALINHPLERICAILMVSGIVAYLVLLFFALGGGSAPISTLSGTVITSALIAVRVRQVSRDIGRDARNA